MMFQILCINEPISCMPASSSYRATLDKKIDKLDKTLAVSCANAQGTWQHMN